MLSWLAKYCSEGRNARAAKQYLSLVTAFVLLRSCAVNGLRCPATQMLIAMC